MAQRYITTFKKDEKGNTIRNIAFQFPGGSCGVVSFFEKDLQNILASLGQEASDLMATILVESLDKAEPETTEQAEPKHAELEPKQ